MTGAHTFNRARGLGLLFLFALGVAASGLAFWMQTWEKQTMVATTTGGGSTFTYTFERGLKTSTTTTVDGMGAVTVTGTDYTEDFKGSACDQKCKFNYIIYLLQIVATSIGLATWTLWLGMTFFNAFRHGMLATTGIWLTGLCQGAACGLFVWNVVGDFSADLSSKVPALYSMINMQTSYGYAFGLSMGSACWCIVVLAIYVNSCRQKALLSEARSEVAPADFARSSSQRELGSTAGGNKSAAWVV